MVANACECVWSLNRAMKQTSQCTIPRTAKCPGPLLNVYTNKQINIERKEQSNKSKTETDRDAIVINLIEKLSAFFFLSFQEWFMNAW